MRERFVNRGGTAGRRTAARAYARKRAALLVAITLTVAATVWVVVGENGILQKLMWESDGAAAQQDAILREAAIPQTPAPLRISVRETELITETVSVTASSAPRVLIYHTHASEAYLPTADEPYTPSGSWRTLDNGRNVVAIGALLQKTLREEYGIEAVHDTENYELPKLATAYNRSLAAMERHTAENPSIELYIDVHRDAYGENAENVPLDYLELSGEQVARIMLVVGTGEGATGGGFPELPDFEANLRLAETVNSNLRAADERLARDIRVKTGRYNQHVSDRCMLVEVGHTANTLSQAKNAVPYLARAVAEALKSAPEPDTLSTMRVWTP